jgi:ATP/maltotriose-dependent transcriptional regulator MalT
MDQGELEAAWKQLLVMEEEARSPDFDMNRYQWESRMKCLAAQIHVSRNEFDQAETIIRENLNKVRKNLLKKREGNLLRILGEVQMRRNEAEKAIATLNQALEILHEVENPRQLWQTCSCLATVYERMGRSAEAHEQWGVASKIIQNSADDLVNRELRDKFLHAEPIRGILSKAVPV